ncbi:MAG: bifunctional riboflavin kinase/FAD synthetase [Saprospiraceae bacterium]|nr:bifunctional riboflavin kinase/FAD synthetase [Saprospiraceae bacterium]
MRVFTDLSQLPTFRNAVVTIGSFDGVHLGHRRILERLQSLAHQNDGESVVITFDPHPRTVLKPDDATFKLLTTTEEKIALLAQAGIDNVVVAPFSLEFSRQSALHYVEDFLIQKFAPRFIVIGYDHRFGTGREGDIGFLKKFEKTAGFEVVEISAQEVDEIAVSSSKIRKALEISDIVLANRLLGHPFSFTGEVVTGNKIGRNIGFPTANLEVADPHKLILPEGIYAATVGAHKAALYIGKRPTLSPNGKRVIEVNILDFEGELYGQNLTVEVLDFIRPDKKLDNLEDLKKQISADRAEIVSRLNQMQDGGQWTADIRSGAARSKIQGPRSDVAVVILNYNTRRHLEQFLPSVVANSPGARIIVADNGSPDDSMEFLRKQYPGVELIDLQQNWGFAEGYNRALKQVQAEIYVILNSDVAVSPNWLEPILTAMKNDPTIAVVQPKILAWKEVSTLNPKPSTNLAAEALSKESHQFEYAGASGGWIDQLGYPFCRGRIFSQREADHGQYDTPQECFWASGAAFFIRAELYHTFSGFDGDYFAHNEEIDLCWRLKRAGYSIWCIPQSVVWHLGGGTLEYENPRKVFLNFRNSLYSLLKNEPWGKLLWLIPARLLLDGLAGARFAVKGQFRAIWAIVRAHFSFYGNFRLMCRKRQEGFQIIEKQKIAPKNEKGIYPGSIIVAHYLRRVKVFSKL